MKTAAAIGWRPWEFWTATPHELLAAIDGWNLARGSREALREEREESFATFRAGLERSGGG
jgi:hypothetical protein